MLNTVDDPLSQAGKETKMINTIEIESTSRQNVQHTLWMDEHGKAIGCSCEARQFNAFKACRHMTSWNTTEQQRKDEERTAYNYYELAIGA